MFGVLLAVFTVYKDYKFMEIRSESSLFEGRNFCYAVIDAAILGFIFDSVFGRI